MSQALWIAKTGIEAQQTRISTISNNLANVSTTGYKRARPIFEDLLYQNVRQVGASSSQDTQLATGLALGTGVRAVATEKIFTQGSLTQTGNSLDVAIQGRGFLQVLMPDGTFAYTRDGSFKLDGQGQLVTSSGFQIQPSISVPANSQSLTIGADGTVSALLPGNASPTQIGTLQLTDFVNPSGLQAIGQNLYLESVSSGTAQTGTPGVGGLGTLVQGSLESSNVNVVEELVNMIETQRAYEMASKAIKTVDDMLAYANNQL